MELFQMARMGQIARLPQPVVLQGEICLSTRGSGSLVLLWELRFGCYEEIR